MKDRVTEADIKMTNFLVQHNLPLATASHIGPLMRSCFPDSQIKEEYNVQQQKRCNNQGSIPSV